jgi:hypothetical protein
MHVNTAAAEIAATPSIKKIYGGLNIPVMPSPSLLHVEQTDRFLK